MCPESEEHGRIKEIVLKKLKEVYGTGLTEYPQGGQINDVYVVTQNQGEIFVENIWTSTRSNFQRDLNILHRSPANIKILIASPEIVKDGKLCREFEKTRMSETKRGIAVSNMIDGSKILNEPKFVDEEFPRIVRELVREYLSKISVTPETMAIGIGNWQTHSMFKVHNRTDEVFYQIWVKLTVDGLNVTTRDIEVEVVRPRDDDLKIKAGGIEWSTRVVRYNGTDKTGNKAVFLLIADLNPRETLSFVLGNINPKPSAVFYQVRVALSVVGFSRKPATILSQKGKVAMSFTPPESFKLEGVALRLKKTSVRAE
jgi:hypothetical protein